MRHKTKIAAVQMEPKITANKENLDKIVRKTETAARNGGDLVVFPECALTGYIFTSREEVLPHAETIPGTSTDRLEACCRELGVYVIAGLIERTSDKCFNTAVLIGPEGFIGRYRKIHLPFLGVDRFLDRGDEPFRVYETEIGNIGMHICYDCNFPESARVMTLMGADILALPTNWPEGRQRIPKYVAPTRAYENKVHLVAVNRVGWERGTKFIGQSKIINAWGDTLAEASIEDEKILYGEVSLAEAREKRTILRPGEFEVDFIRDRRPEFYGKITET
jgi:predicted amidohydrolase